LIVAILVLSIGPRLGRPRQPAPISSS